MRYRLLSRRRKLVGVKERTVEQRDVVATNDAREVLTPRAPRVDVGQVEQRSPRTAHDECDGVAEFGAVRNRKRFDFEVVGKPCRRVGLDADRQEIAVVEQRSPRLIFPEEPEHGIGGVKREPADVHRFATELQQSGIVSDVGMGDEKT